MYVLIVLFSGIVMCFEFGFNIVVVGCGFCCLFGLFRNIWLMFVGCLLVLFFMRVMF